MEDKVNEIEKLSNEELLSLYAAILEHLKYLEGSLLSLEEPEEEGGDSNE